MWGRGQQLRPDHRDSGPRMAVGTAATCQSTSVPPRACGASWGALASAAAGQWWLPREGAAL